MKKKTLDFRISRNDMFWKATIYDSDEFWHIYLSGYNDDNWWNKVGDKKHRITLKSENGIKNRFIIDYRNNTVEYTPIMEVLKEYQDGNKRCYKKELEKYKKALDLACEQNWCPYEGLCSDLLEDSNNIYMLKCVKHKEEWALKHAVEEE